MSGIYYYRPYDKKAYTEYLESICKHSGATFILNKYLILEVNSSEGEQLYARYSIMP